MYPKWNQLQHLNLFLEDKAAVYCSTQILQDRFVLYLKALNLDLCYDHIDAFEIERCVSICHANNAKYVYNNGSIDFHERCKYIMTEFTGD